MTISKTEQCFEEIGRDLYFVQGSCDHMPLCFQPLPLPILPPPTSSGHPCYTAIYDYKAASEDQVSFMEGKTMQSCSPIYSSVWGHKAGEPKSLLCLHLLAKQVGRFVMACV